MMFCLRYNFRLGTTFSKLVGRSPTRSRGSSKSFSSAYGVRGGAEGDARSGMKFGSGSALIITAHFRYRYPGLTGVPTFSGPGKGSVKRGLKRSYVSLTIDGS